MPSRRQRARSRARRLARRVGLPSRATWPYTLPGAAPLHELRWEWMVRRTPAVTLEQHAANVPLRDIEELIGCSLCGERRIQPLLHPHDRERRPPRWSYHVVRCPACGFLYRNPGIRPERLGELYSRHYSRFLTGRYATDRRRRYALVMDAFAPLLAKGDGRRLLDFGCGAGLFLELAHERGFDGYGVDLSADSVEHARGRPGGENAYFGSPADVPAIAAGGFDVVTMWSVLAHLPCPVEDLTMLRGLLSRDGVLLILTVNANSLVLKARRDDWNGFTPNHLKFFSPTTLTMLLRQAGFGAVVFRPMYGETIEQGTTELRLRHQRRLRRAVDRGNRANMLRAVAFADPGGPRRWGLQDGAVRL